jgi:serine/threonine protein phosphatase PrpC
MSLSLRFAARSDVGLLREGNEDSGYAGPRLLAVADGMGGQAAGEVASSIVVATIAPLDEDVPGSELLDSLARSVEEANDHLREMVRENPQLEGMGTTLTALLWAGSRLGLVHVGDSRAYLLRDGELQQITQDHTWVQRLVDEGRITAEEADHHPQRSLLMRAIDGRGNVDLDLSVREARPGDRYLLCSDGLSGVVSFDTIGSTLAKGDPAAAVEALVDLALRGGGPDNVTCIVADVVDVDSRPSTVPQVVGAAADERTGGSQASLDTSAGRAHKALSPAPSEDEERFDDEPGGGPGSRGTWVRRFLGLSVLLALLAGGGYGAYRWSQTQYYVGADGDRVAIYRGLNQAVFGMQLSSMHEQTDVAIPDLPESYRNDVKGTLEAGDLPRAREIVSNLRERAEACAQARAAAAVPKVTPTPTPTPNGRQPVTTAPTPTPSNTARPGSTTSTVACGTAAER